MVDDGRSEEHSAGAEGADKGVSSFAGQRAMVRVCPQGPNGIHGALRPSSPPEGPLTDSNGAESNKLNWQRLALEMQQNRERLVENSGQGNLYGRAEVQVRVQAESQS
jgi:hypothetical protein